MMLYSCRYVNKHKIFLTLIQLNRMCKKFFDVVNVINFLKV
jgi:hypothetical protein